MQAAKLDLERIFNQGGVAALVGATYSASNSGALYATGEAIRGLAEDVRAESSKGVSSGPVYNIGQLKDGGLDAYPAVEFVGGEYAEVYVEAKSATDMNLSVYDSKGRLVCSDTDKSHIAYCGWRPAQSDSFVMKVENLGPNGAKYALMTN